MSDAKNTYTVEQILECINHVSLEDIRVHGKLQFKTKEPTETEVRDNDHK